MAIKVEIPKEKPVAVTTPGISSTMKGADGHSPYISATGTWVVWDDTQHVWVDTNVVAEGKDGYTPVKGVDYFDGKDGKTPVKGVDYKDGDPGYTPVKGTDYYTDAEKTAFVDEVKDAVQPSVSQLNNQIVNQGKAIETKLTQPESVAVGKYFRVAAVDENGHAVLEAVDLPIATNNAYGLAMANPTYGIGQNAVGLYVSASNDNEIANRNNGNRPIVPTKLNYAVKAALSDAKRIGTNNDGMTDAEKALACETIGAAYDGTFELIESFTINAVGGFDKNSTPSGEAYQFRNVVVNLVVPAASNASVTIWFVASNGSTTKTRGIGITDGIGTTKNYCNFNARIENGAFVGTGNKSNEIGLLSRLSSASGTLFDGFIHRSINRIVCYNSFPVGTTVEIYAIKA